MTQDRSYTSNEQYIFQMCGVESWTELWEQLSEIEFMQALIGEGLMSEVGIRNRMIREVVSKSENKSEAIRSLSRDLRLSKHTVRDYAYL